MRLRPLKARLDQLETSQKEAERLHQEADRKLEDKITADQLSQATKKQDHFLTVEGFTAGYSDHRFVIQSDDGNFALRPFLHFRSAGCGRRPA